MSFSYREFTEGVKKMSNFIDMTGQKFGKLTVVGLADPTNKTKWRCKCECGNEVDVFGTNLRRGLTKSCGCSKSEKRINIMNQRFEKLVVEKMLFQNGKSYCLCRCDCGNEKVILASSLLNHGTRSCGCLNREVAKRLCLQNKTHGETKTRLYHVWQGMKRRTCKIDDPKYPIYGGRGIKMCDEWRNDFVAFRTWAMENGYDPNAKYGDCTIDRIDVNGDYEPSNCRWVDLKVQARNRRSNRNGTEILTVTKC